MHVDESEAWEFKESSVCKSMMVFLHRSTFY